MGNRHDFLSVEKYISPSAFEPYWRDGNWHQVPVTTWWLYQHRYAGEAAIILLEQMGVLDPKAEKTSQTDNPVEFGGPKRTLFDIGCGTGLLTTLVYDHVPPNRDIRVISLDKELAFMEELAKRQEMGKWTDWTGITAEFYMEENALPDGSVDYLAAGHFLFYLAKDFPRAFTECRRLLKPNGLLGWTAPSYCYPIEDITRILKDLPSPPPEASAFPPEMPNVVLNTTDGSLKMMEANGFKPLYIQEIEVQVPLESPRQAAESCASILLTFSEKWPEASVKQVTDGLEKYYTEVFGEGRKGTRTNRTVVAVGRMVGTI